MSTTGRLYYILDEDGKTPIPASLEEWGRMFMDPEKRTVSRTELIIGGDTVVVSTVFLGLDHNFSPAGGPPILFETMIFGGEHDQYQIRCSTHEQALEQHEAVERIAMNEDFDTEQIAELLLKEVYEIQNIEYDIPNKYEVSRADELRNIRIKDYWFDFMRLADVIVNERRRQQEAKQSESTDMVSHILKQKS